MQVINASNKTLNQSSLLIHSHPTAPSLPDRPPADRHDLSYLDDLVKFFLSSQLIMTATDNDDHYYSFHLSLLRYSHSIQSWSLFPPFSCRIAVLSHSDTDTRVEM